ncbi:MAG: hypothetical protein H7323_14395 [Frankiales bacterium]|nr:hypothetical protein [Frankiales bacterium]
MAWAVLPYGPGHSPDSATYLAAARSMADLRGYLDLDGQSPMLDFPPLYPAVLTFSMLLGASSSTAAALVDATCLAGLALAVRSLALHLSLGSPTALGLGLLAIVLPPVIDSDTSVLSEPMFLALAAIVASTLTGVVAAGTNRRRSIVLVTALAAACLTRYLGVGLVAGSFLALVAAAPDRSLKSLRRVLLIPIIAVIPLSLWLLRNIVVGGSATAGDYGATSTPLLGHVRGDLSGMGSWYIGQTDGALPLVVGALAVVVLLGAAVGRGQGQRPAAPAALLCCAYLGTVLFAQSIVGLDTDDRFLRPVAALVPVLALSLVRTWWSVALPQARTWWWPSRLLPGVAVSAVMVLSVLSLHTLLTAAADDGLGDYDGQQWRDSPTLSAVRHLSDKDPLVSNDAYAVSLLTSRSVAESPSRTYDNSTQATGDLSQFGLDATKNHPVVIWLNSPDIDGLESLAQLKTVACLTVLATYADGQILRSC